MTYPQPRKEPTSLTLHGKTRTDEYRWMHDKDDPEVQSVIQEEKAYTQAFMKDTQDLQEELYQEIRGRMREEDETVPRWYRNYAYFERTHQGCDYASHWRIDEAGEEECLLDGNTEAQGYDYWDLGEFEVSPSEKLFAYAVDYTGDEYFTLYIKEIESNTLIATISDIADAGVVFTYQEDGVYFVRANQMHRPYQVWRHDFTTGEETLVYQNDDEHFFVGIGLSKSETTIFIQAQSKNTTDILYRAYAEEDKNFARKIPFTEGHEYQIFPYESFWIIVSNWGEKHNKQVYRLARGEDFSQAEVILPETEFHIDGIDPSQEFFVVYRTGQVRSECGVFSLTNNSWYSLSFRYPVYSVSSGGGNLFESSTFRYIYQHPFQPPQLWEYDVCTRRSKLLKEKTPKGGFDASPYSLSQKFYTAQDGTQIPVTCMYREELTFPAPTYMFGYGAYGIADIPGFSQSKLSLLDRGVVIAIAHVRGGGELGEYWHHEGRLEKKNNTFTDFIAVTEGLISDGVSEPKQLVAHSGSAGGMLLGYVMNERPELYAGILADVPFVDVLNTMCDEELPLTVTEYEEWGNPQQEEMYNEIASYSPYDNVKSQRYPITLALTGLNDPRVMYWEPFKWISRLRDQADNPEDIMLHIYDNGHLGASGRFAYLRELVFHYAFILKVVQCKNLLDLTSEE